MDFRLQSLAISPRYQAAVFSLAYASSIVLDNSFRKHSAIIFQYIYFFLIWTWLFDRQTLVSVYIQRNPALRPPRLQDHLVSTPIASRPRREKLRVILLFWRPLQCDHLAILRPGFYGPTLVASTVIYKKLARLEGWPNLSSRPFVMVGLAP